MHRSRYPNSETMYSTRRNSSNNNSFGSINRPLSIFQPSFSSINSPRSMFLNSPNFSQSFSSSSTQVNPNIQCSGALTSLNSLARFRFRPTFDNRVETSLRPSFGNPNSPGIVTCTPSFGTSSAIQSSQPWSFGSFSNFTSSSTSSPGLFSLSGSQFTSSSAFQIGQPNFNPPISNDTMRSFSDISNLVPSPRPSILGSGNNISANNFGLSQQRVNDGKFINKLDS